MATPPPRKSDIAQQLERLNNKLKTAAACILVAVVIGGFVLVGLWNSRTVKQKQEERIQQIEDRNERMKDLDARTKDFERRRQIIDELLNKTEK